jgi:PAS domain S-box-containing protein
LVVAWTLVLSATVYWAFQFEDAVDAALHLFLWILGVVGIVGGGWHLAWRQQRFEEELGRSQSNLVAAQRLAHLGSWEAGLDTSGELKRSYLIWSDEVYRIFGYEPGSIEPTSELFFQAVVPEDRDALKAAVQEAVLQRKTYQIEHRIRRPNGQERFVREHAEVTSDAAGVVRLLGTVQDITDQKAIEEQLREKEQFISAVARNSPDFIVVFDLVRRVAVYRNKVAPESLGFSTEDWKEAEIGGLTSLLHPEDWPRLEAHFERVAKAADGQVLSVEFRIRRKQGGYSSFLARDTVFKRDASGRVVQTLSVAQDITERQLAEATLRASEERFRRAVIESPFPMILHAEDGAILQLSRSWTRLSGYTLDELPTIEAWAERVYGERKGGVLEGIQRLYSLEGPLAEGEFSIRTKDGSFRIWDFSTAPLGRLPDGRRHVLSMAMDVTDRKALEEQLRQAQKMEAVGQLAGGVAHDFNNILTAMLMQLSLLQLSPELPGNVREGLSDLEKGAHRAAELTRQLLMFSRRQVLQIKPLDLNQVVTGMLKMLRRLLREDIVLEFHPERPTAWVAADAGMMEQVLMNLLVNARDAMPKAGRVTIATRQIELAPQRHQSGLEAQSGQFVCLSVSDTGVGMEAVTLKRIFEPFFTTKEVGKGTGLGLATVYGIVKQHRGWIEVDSSPGHGTRFDIYLPLGSSPRPSARAELQGTVLGGSETILLVEDDESVRRAVRGELQRLGYNVLEAGNADQALSAWGQHHASIDLLYTDMIMPGGMTGLDLAERLRASKPKLKILLSSGYSLELSAVGALSEKRISYLAKPCDTALLAQSIRQCLDKPV